MDSFGWWVEDYANVAINYFSIVFAVQQQITVANIIIVIITHVTLNWLNLNFVWLLVNWYESTIMPQYYLAVDLTVQNCFTFYFGCSNCLLMDPNFKIFTDFHMLIKNHYFVSKSFNLVAAVKSLPSFGIKIT